MRLFWAMLACGSLARSAAFSSISRSVASSFSCSQAKSTRRSMSSHWAFQKHSKVFFNRLKLSESNNEIMRQQLGPYADWSLFKAIKSKFISKFSNQPVIGIAFYGLALVIANDVFRRQQVRRKLPC